VRRTVLAAVTCVAVMGMSAGETPRIPLVKDLTIVEAWRGPPTQGDYEASTRVDAVDGQSVTLTLISRSLGLEIDTRMARTTMRDARTYRQVWTAVDPEVIAGATSMTVSSALLSELATKGMTTMTIIPRIGTAKNGAMLEQMGVIAKAVFSDSITTGTPYTGTLRRIEAAAVPFALLLNGYPASVAAIHARGMVVAESDSINIEMYILDDPALPIVLASGVVGGAAGGEGGRVIKITYPDSTLVAELEQQLASRRPVEVYDVYFDYNEATITPQSNVALHDIAAIMRRHPDWRLDIVGHTDSIGTSGVGNMALSTRRATAVRDALTGRYNVAEDRLTTHGAGGSQPVATNATLEGRAKNRRVELRRL
jgi:flagellar motor protein MotB